MARCYAPPPPPHGSCSWVLHPHSPSIGNGAAARVQQHQDGCSSCNTKATARMLLLRVTRLRCY